MKSPLLRHYLMLLLVLALLSDVTGGATRALWALAATPAVLTVAGLLMVCTLGLLFGLLGPRRR